MNWTRLFAFSFAVIVFLASSSSCRRSNSHVGYFRSNGPASGYAVYQGANGGVFHYTPSNYKYYLNERQVRYNVDYL